MECHNINFSLVRGKAKKVLFCLQYINDNGMEFWNARTGRDLPHLLKLF